MTPSPIADRRLHHQRLDGTTFSTPGELVAAFGAVQAQEYALAKWALGQRLPNATDAGIEQALTAGDLLRTHVMRPTWHFVARDDIRWMLSLTAPRVIAWMSYRYRQLELDDDLIARSNAIIGEALQGGQMLTRLELGEKLAAAGIASPQGERLTHIVMRAELAGIAVSGARRGKQFTYALISERAPGANDLPRDAALAELVLRYFSTHGPATVKDFAWWSGLTMADGREGIALVGSRLANETIAGVDYWFTANPHPAPAAVLPRPTAWLLSPYDEFTIAYRDHSAILAPEHQAMAESPVFFGVIAIDGQLAGSWRRLQSGAQVEIIRFRSYSPDETDALATAVARYSAFLEKPLTWEDRTDAA